MGAKIEIYRLLEDLCDQGVGVLIISLEMPEVLGIADKILVIHDGTIAGEFRRRDADQDELMRCAWAYARRINEHRQGRKSAGGYLDQEDRQRRRTRLASAGLMVFLFLAIAYFSAASPYFLSVKNFVNILLSVAMIGIVASGMTLVLVGGGLDL